MEAVLEKTKVLETQGAPCPPCPRLDRLSFVVKQPHQLERLLQVASWLCSFLSDDKMPTVVQYRSVETLGTALARRQLGVDTAAVQQGHGEAVCRFLDRLCDAALGQQGFAWQTPIYHPPQEVAEAKHEEDGPKHASPDTKSVAKATGPAVAAAKGEAEAKDARLPAKQTVAEGKGTSPSDEVESKARRCRERITQAKAHVVEMEASCQAKQGRVDALKKQLARLQEKEDRLEKEEERTLREHQQLGGATGENDTGKGGGGGEPGPVAKLKAALQELKKEIRGLDVRTGIMQHLLLHAQDGKRRGLRSIHHVLVLQRGSSMGLEEEEEEEEVEARAH